MKKPTKFITNSECIAEELSKRCNGQHHHVQLKGGKAKAAAVYPPALSKAICRGLKMQLEKDDEHFSIYLYAIENAQLDTEEEAFIDDVNGGELNPKNFRKPEHLRWMT